MSMGRVTPSQDDLVKEAGGKAKYILGAALGAAVPVGVKMVSDSIARSRAAKERAAVWKEVIKRDPSLKGEDGEEIYGALYDLSPSLMKHPMLAIPALRRSREYATGGIPSELAHLLAKTEEARETNPLLIPKDVVGGAQLGVKLTEKLSDDDD